jgi:hypothetical protein
MEEGMPMESPVPTYLLDHFASLTRPQELQSPSSLVRYFRHCPVCIVAVTVDVDLALNERRHVHLASDSHGFADVHTDPHLPSQLGLRHYAPGMLDQILQHAKAQRLHQGLPGFSMNSI